MYNTYVIFFFWGGLGPNFWDTPHVSNGSCFAKIFQHGMILWMDINQKQRGDAATVSWWMIFVGQDNTGTTCFFGMFFAMSCCFSSLCVLVYILRITFIISQKKGLKTPQNTMQLSTRLNYDSNPLNFRLDTDPLMNKTQLVRQESFSTRASKSNIATVDWRNPKQPPGMYQTLSIMG